MYFFVIKNGFKNNLFVGNILIEMYFGVGESGLAYKMFGEIFLRNIIVWIFMINGLILCG